MLDAFFTPKSIAVVGASANKEKLGAVVYHNILAHGFRGRVYPVNVKGGAIGKKKVFTSVVDIPGKVDLALIVIPAPFVADVIRECGKKRIRAAIIISAGFGEIGAKGKVLEEKLLHVARAAHVRVLGPNCLGLISPVRKLNASFAEGLPDTGGVAVLSQSGAMAVAITDWALDMDIGFSALVSLGNKGDVEEEELLKYFARDPKTKVIVAYLESIKHGRGFLRTLNRVTQNKPVVVLKPGKSTQAQAAVASHTGSLAGTYEVQHASLAAAGAVVVNSLEELFLFTQAFEKKHILKNQRVAIVTNAGGPGIIATDALIGSGFSLAQFAPKTVATLKRKLPEAASTHNPVDVVGDAPASRYAAALRTVIQDAGVDAVVAILTHQYVTETEKIARSIIRVSQQSKKPLFVSFVGGKGVERGRDMLSDQDVPQFLFPEQAVRALHALWRAKHPSFSYGRFPDVHGKSGSKLVPLVGTKGENLLQKYAPYVLRSKVSSSVSGTLRNARRIGYPVVAKVSSARFLHKTDLGFVRINITTEKELKKLLAQWSKKVKGEFAKGEGFVIQAYRPAEVEFFLGAKRDPLLGPYLVFGLGGIFVKEISETEIFPAPISLAGAREILQLGKVGKILSSKRGAKIPKEQLATCIAGLSRLMIERSEIAECDLNPVIVRNDGVYLPDVRLLKSGS